MPNEEQQFEQLAEEGLSYIEGDTKIHFNRINDRIDQRVKKVYWYSNKDILNWKLLLVVIIVLGCLYMVFKKEPNHSEIHVEKIFATYYEKFPNVISGVIRSENLTPEQDSLSQAVALYHQGKTQLALFLFPQNPSKDQIDMTNLYHALTKLDIGQSSEAIKTFNKLESSSEAGISQASQWYNSLAQIRVGKLKHAKVKLKTIINDSTHYKHREAIEVFNLLN